MESITIDRSLCETVGYHITSVKPDQCFQDFCLKKSPNVLDMREQFSAGILMNVARTAAYTLMASTYKLNLTFQPPVSLRVLASAAFLHLQ